jgi:hypothetical protein
MGDKQGVGYLSAWPPANELHTDGRWRPELSATAMANLQALWSPLFQNPHVHEIRNIFPIYSSARHVSIEVLLVASC